MLVLYETAVGYAIFQVLNEKKFKKADDVAAYFADGKNDPKAFYKLLAFTKFNDTKEALTAATSNLNGKANETLMATINKVFKEGVKETLAVADTSIGQIIKDEMDVTIPFIHGDYVLELIRGINAHASTLLGAVTDDDINAMRLGLAHSVSRYKLKFSPDKVDTMIVHSVSLLDEIDKQLNNYVMRMKEWYGWHFPELAKLVPDAVAYSKLVTTVGFRNLYAQSDLSEILDREVEAEVKKLAEVSMGTEISDEDITNIRFLAEEIVEFTDYREKLNTYLRERMLAIAPNLTNIVGELVGARLISHAGSLVNLAKHPASTVQILGAEKALFRALKTRKDTPKYGLIYHASIVSQCSAKNKGKMSRMLAAKAALGCRVDALSDESTCEVAVNALEKLNTQMQRLENTKISTGALKMPVKQESKQYQNKSTVVKFEAEGSSLPSADTKVTLIKSEPSLIVADGELQGEPATTEKKKKKKKKKDAAAEATEAETPKCEKKKKKKRKAEESPAEAAEAPEKKKKKKKKSAAAE